MRCHDAWGDSFRAFQVLCGVRDESECGVYQRMISPDSRSCCGRADSGHDDGRSEFPHESRNIYLYQYLKSIYSADLYDFLTGEVAITG